jgi:hypothetical protein
MSQKRHSVDQIMAKLCRADVLLGKDTKVPDICKQLEIAEQTYYRWRQKYGGMQPCCLSRHSDIFCPSSRQRNAFM